MIHLKQDFWSILDQTMNFALGFSRFIVKRTRVRLMPVAIGERNAADTLGETSTRKIRKKLVLLAKLELISLILTLLTQSLADVKDEGID